MVLSRTEDDVDIQDTCFNGSYWIRFGCVIQNSEIGDHSFLGFKTRISNTQIGCHCQIASKCQIGNNYHKKTIIEDNVWIGTNVSILPGIRINKGAIIGAGSYVTEDVSDFTIAYGRPAKERKKYQPEESGHPSFQSILKKIASRKNQSTLPQEFARVGDQNHVDCDIIAIPKHFNRSASIGSRNILIGRKDGPSINGGLTIGENLSIGSNNIIEGGGGISIGQNTVIGDSITITSNTHDFNFTDLPWIEAPVQIGENVFVGNNSIIIGPCKIGDHAIILPNSIIKGNVSRNSISMGI